MILAGIGGFILFVFFFEVGLYKSLFTVYVLLNDVSNFSYVYYQSCIGII